MNASSQLPPGRRLSGSAVAARFFYRQLFIRRPLALGLLVVPLAMLLLGLRPGALLTCIFSLGSLPVLGVTLMPPHLPVSRRQLLTWSSLPAVAVIMIGFVASLASGPSGPVATLIGGVAPAPFVVSAADAAQRAPAGEFADDLWRLGEPDPEGVVLPDGTRVAPERRSLGGLIVAHNPFTVPADASLDQAAIQVHRAIEACCDLRLSVAQVRAHLADGGPGSAGSLAVAAAQRRHVSAAGLSFSYLLLALLTLCWARIVLSFQSSAARAARRGSVRGSLQKWLGAGLAVAFALGVISAVVVTLANQNPFFGPRFLAALLLRAWESHPVLGALLGAAAAFLLGRSLLRRYERLELPLPSTAWPGHRC